MADKTERVHANSETLVGVIINVIEDLRGLFNKFAAPYGKYEDYVNFRFDKMARDRSINEKSICDDFFEQCNANSSKMRAYEGVLMAINISLYFCFRAKESYAAGDNERAWCFTSDASKWQGMAFGREYAYHVGQETERSLAASGGKRRSDSYEPLRQFALEAVKKRIYPSRRNAALSIKAEVLKLAAELRIPLSEQQAERTITGWLQDVPFASTRGT